MRVISWVIAFIIVLILILVIWRWRSFEPETGFGTFSEPLTGPCMVPSGLCSEQGERTITQTCIPNSTTGKGCIGPDGKQTYNLLVTRELCNIACRSSIWQDITPDTAMCILLDDNDEPIPPDVCILPDQRGTRRRMLKCIAQDTTGPNACTSLEIRQIIGPTGVPGDFNQVVTYSIGNIVEVNELCDDFPNSTCGDWELVQPFNRDPTKPIGSEDTISACSFDTFLIPAVGCTVEKISTWNDLREGYLGQPMGCVIPEETGNFAVIPTFSDPQLKICEILDRPICSKTGVSPSQIIDESLLANFNPLKCANVLAPPDVSNNPQCVRACRLDTVTTSVGIKEFKPILGKVMIMEIPDFYLSVYQTPRTDGKLIQFSDQVASPEADLDDVPLFYVGFPGTCMESKNCPSRNGCTTDQIQYDSSLMFVLAPRRASGNKLICQIMIMIDGSYLGWLTVDNSSLVSTQKIGLWRQAYTKYKGFGINTNVAQEFEITINEPFVPENGEGTQESNPPKLEGTIELTIKKLNGQSIPVLDSLGAIKTLDNIKALVFNQDVQIGTRIDRCKGNCNILHDPNGVPGHPNCN